jgi:hypothetical protein
MLPVYEDKGRNQTECSELARQALQLNIKSSFEKPVNRHKQLKLAAVLGLIGLAAAAARASLAGLKALLLLIPALRAPKPPFCVVLPIQHFLIVSGLHRRAPIVFRPTTPRAGSVLYHSIKQCNASPVDRHATPAYTIFQEQRCRVCHCVAYPRGRQVTFQGTHPDRGLVSTSTEQKRMRPKDDCRCRWESILVNAGSRSAELMASRGYRSTSPSEHG